jgi:hypothetical protein
VRPLAAAGPNGTVVSMAKSKSRGESKEIAVVGEVDDWEEDVVKALLEVPAGGS